MSGTLARAASPARAVRDERVEAAEPADRRLEVVERVRLGDPVHDLAMDPAVLDAS